VHEPWLIDPNAIHEPETTQGMEQYTLVLLKSGEKWNPSAPAFMDVMKQHLAFVKEMTERGKIAVAGPFPFGDPGELRGITIYRSGAEETVEDRTGGSHRQSRTIEHRNASVDHG
jgi:uncharacterized protein YciI